MRPMKPRTFALIIFLLIVLFDGMLHRDNFRARNQYAPQPVDEIELPDIHFTN